jgi:polysaccharide export outer membrane protein
MKNIENLAIETSQQTNKNTLQPGDQLMISVAAEDMEVTAPFNQNPRSSELSAYSNGRTNILQQNQVSVSGPMYTIDTNGNIDFPILGQINTTGKTLEDLKKELQNGILVYVKNPTVNVRLTNYRISILGEVQNPGYFTIPGGEITFLEALAMSGDLTMNGKRENILIVRNEDGKISKGYVNLQDADFINSPYYKLKQNDVIYVSPNKSKERQAKQNPNLGIIMSAVSVGISAVAIVVTLINKN